jgi:hypothetical protein
MTGGYSRMLTLPMAFSSFLDAFTTGLIIFGDAKPNLILIPNDALQQRGPLRRLQAPGCEALLDNGLRLSACNP